MGAIQRLVPGCQGHLKESFVLHRPSCGERLDLYPRGRDAPSPAWGHVPARRASSLRAVGTGAGSCFARVFGVSCFR